MQLLYIYLAVINLIAVIITIYDKLSAIRGGRRVPERTLMLIASLCGGPGMLLTMLIIRHKTRKPMFMLGIPFIILIEAVLGWLILFYGFGAI